MNRNKLSLLLSALLMMGLVAGSLQHLKANQKLGVPGVTTLPSADKLRLEIPLPENVLNYQSRALPTEKGLLTDLPHDTSFAQRLYTAPGGRQISMRVVLMGTDRTSIHKPEFCLTGQGWKIDSAASGDDSVRVSRPHPYDLPVKRFVTTNKERLSDGKEALVRGIYVFWFVAQNEVTGDENVRIWKTATHLLKTGELQRWAYVSCFTVCAPGGENAAYDDIKKFIAGAVPEFQLAAGKTAGVAN